MHPAFSIEESLKFGWEKTKQHSRLVFGAVLTIFALQVGSAIVSRVLADTLLGFAAQIVLLVVGVVVGTGLMVISLKLAKGEHASYSDIVPSVRLVWYVLLASLLAGVVVVIGFILLIIPGIYFMLRYFMVKFAVIDGAGITQSLRTSAQMTEGVKWHLLGFLLVVVVLNIIGAILLLVGLLITVPVSLIAYAHIFEKLKHHHVHHTHHMNTA